MGRHYEFNRPDLINVKITLDSRQFFNRVRRNNEPMWTTVERFLNEHKDVVDMQELIVKLQNTIAHQHEIIQGYKQQTLLNFIPSERTGV